MAEYFEEDDKDIEVIYDSTTAFKKEEIKQESKSGLSSVKKEGEASEHKEHDKELELMAKMNLPTQFVYSNGRYQDDIRLSENCRRFCSLCQVEMKDDRAYEAHVRGKKHLKKMIATRLRS